MLVKESMKRDDLEEIKYKKLLKVEKYFHIVSLCFIDRIAILEKSLDKLTTVYATFPVCMIMI